MTKETGDGEMVQHTIVIDKYATAVLSIPKVMDALQFKGLVVKANKLFNLSTDEAIESLARKTSPAAQADKVVRNLEAGLTPTGRKRRTLSSPQVKWTEEMDRLLSKLVGDRKLGGKSVKQVIEELERRFPSERGKLTPKRVRVRAWFVRNGRLGWQQGVRS